MTPRTLRRKLQKKVKRKPFAKCPACGQRVEFRVSDHRGKGREPFIVGNCQAVMCNVEIIKGWSGGGTGRHIGPGSNPCDRPKA